MTEFPWCCQDFRIPGCQVWITWARNVKALKNTNEAEKSKSQQVRMYRKKESGLSNFSPERKRRSKSMPDPAFSHFLCFQRLFIYLFIFFLSFFLSFFWLKMSSLMFQISEACFIPSHLHVSLGIVITITRAGDSSLSSESYYPAVKFNWVASFLWKINKTASSATGK